MLSLPLSLALLSCLCATGLAQQQDLVNPPAGTCGIYTPGSGKKCRIRGSLGNEDLLPSTAASRTASSFTDCRNACYSTLGCVSHGWDYAANSPACFIYGSNLAAQGIKRHKKSSLVYSDIACYGFHNIQQAVGDSDFDNGEVDAWENGDVTLSPQGTGDNSAYAAELTMSAPDNAGQEYYGTLNQEVFLCGNVQYIFSYAASVVDVSGTSTDGDSPYFYANIRDPSFNNIVYKEADCYLDGSDSCLFSESGTDTIVVNKDEWTDGPSVTFTTTQSGTYLLQMGVAAVPGSSITARFDNIEITPVT